MAFKKITPIAFVTIILFAFGISALNFDDFSIEKNIKAYILIGGGIISGIIQLVSSRKK